MARQKLGPNQKEWLERIRVAGGRVYLLVDHTVPPQISSWILMEDSDDIRIPIRMLESLLERDMFEQEREAPGRHRVLYRLKGSDG